MLIKRLFNIVRMAPERKGDRRSAILDAARALFSERGFAGTSVRDISSRAGCNVALISHYFGSKEELLVAVIQSEMNEDARSLGAVLSGAPDSHAALALFVEEAIKQMAQDATLLRIGHRELMQPDSPLLDQLVPPIDGMITALSKHFAGLPERRGLNPRLTALLMVGAMQYCFLAQPLVSRLLGSDPEVLRKELARHVVALFLGDAAPPRRAAPRSPVRKRRKS